MPLTQQNIPVTVIPPAFPNGWCPDAASPWQSLANAIAQGLLITLPGAFSGHIVSDTEPSANDRNKIWDRLLGPTGPYERSYQYFNGMWLATYRVPALSKETLWWRDSLVNLVTYDGGDANPIGDASGPFWEEDTDFQGRSPMAPGNIPSANPVKVLTVGENYGEGAHVQTLAELFPHNHTLDPAAADGFYGHATAPGSFNVLGGTDTVKLASTTNTGGGLAMPVIHPVRGLYACKRTARVYWKAV